MVGSFNVWIKKNANLKLDLESGESEGSRYLLGVVLGASRRWYVCDGLTRLQISYRIHATLNRNNSHWAIHTPLTFSPFFDCNGPLPTDRSSPPLPSSHFCTQVSMEKEHCPFSQHMSVFPIFLLTIQVVLDRLPVWPKNVLAGFWSVRRHEGRVRHVRCERFVEWIVCWKTHMIWWHRLARQTHSESFLMNSTALQVKQESDLKP